MSIFLKIGDQLFFLINLREYTVEPKTFKVLHLKTWATFFDSHQSDFYLRLKELSVVVALV